MVAVLQRSKSCRLLAKLIKLLTWHCCLTFVVPFQVVRKWALSSCRATIEAGSSSGQDSHSESPADSECTAGTEDNDDEKDKKAISSRVFERQYSANKDLQSDDDSLDAEVASFIVDKSADGSVKGKMDAESIGNSPDDLSEDDVKSEDERLPADGVGVAANELLKSWSSLKVSCV